jgi:hypothetical protein
MFRAVHTHAWCVSCLCRHVRATPPERDYGQRINLDVLWKILLSRSSWDGRTPYLNRALKHLTLWNSMYIYLHVVTKSGCHISCFLSRFQKFGPNVIWTNEIEGRFQAVYRWTSGWWQRGSIRDRGKRTFIYSTAVQIGPAVHLASFKICIVDKEVCARWLPLNRIVHMSRIVEIYLHSPIYLPGVVHIYWNTGTECIVLYCIVLYCIVCKNLVSAV